MARLGAAALLVLAALSAVHAQVCSVQAGGSYFDLAKANNGLDATVDMTGTGYTAVLNSCKPISTPDTFICEPGTLACQKSGSAAFKLMAKIISSLDKPVFSSGDKVLKVTYDGGDNCPNAGVDRRVVINYSCDTSVSSLPVYINENPTCTYNFNWMTPAGCPLSAPPAGSGSSGGLSGGDVFLIIFFVGGFLYIAVGAAYNYKMKGQTGMEIIPNIEFWRDVPSLIKDGLVFTGSKLKAMCSK
jgi:hypothetical protein